MTHATTPQPGLSEMLATLRDHVAEGKPARALPGSFYTSKEFLELEEQELFRRGWVCLGRADETPNVGDYRTTVLLNEPLLIVRSSEDTVRVLSNVCRHRAALVAEGSGSGARGFSCPYHAWTYRLDGSLIGAPLMRNVPGFDAHECSLPEFKAEIWAGFLFVNLSGDAEPLTPQLADVDKLIHNYHAEMMTHAFSEDVVWGTNWKSLLENFMEGYHLSVVHSESLKPVTPTELCEYIPGGDAYMGYKAWYPESCPDRGGCHPDLTPEERRFSAMLCVYPNLVMGVCPHQILYMCLYPSGTDAVAARWGVSVFGEVGAEEMEQRMHLYYTINDEDKAQLERVTQGLKSQAYTPGVLAGEHYEGTIRDFQHYLARVLAGATPAAPKPVAEAACDVEHAG